MWILIILYWLIVITFIFLIKANFGSTPRSTNQETLFLYKKTKRNYDILIWRQFSTKKNFHILKINGHNSMFSENTLISLKVNFLFLSLS